MDTARTSLRRPRVDLRQRRSKRTSSPDERARKQIGRGEGKPQRPADRTSITQEEEDKNQVTMTRDHRFFHRRQADTATKVLTVNVEVIATVDTSGNLVGQETKTQSDPAAPTSGADNVALLPNVVSPVESVAAPVAAPVASVVGNAVNALTDSFTQIPPAVPVPAVPSLPQVPTVPAVPTAAIPTVPSVPPFPTDLTVPAYPWPSGVSAAALEVSAAPASSSPIPTSASGSAIPVSSLVALSSISNSTLTSVSSTASLPARGSASLSASGFGSASLAMSSRSGSLTSTRTDSSQHGSATSSPTGGTGILGGAGRPANTADPALNTAAAGSGSSGPTTPLQTPQVVGSVVGSLAGAALILAIILFLLRRHKQKLRGALQLSGDETTDRAPPSMSQDTSRNNRIPSAFLNRFSGMSKSTIETNTSAGERSFQRVSGRKLPSAFSEGMTSDQFSRGGTLSGSSFYTDDQGTYGGPGISKDFGKDVGGSAAAGAGGMSFRPGPARTPIIRHPDDDYSNPFADPAPFPRDTSHLSPPQSPNPDIPRNTLGRSLQSHDGSRSSKFTENV